VIFVPFVDRIVVSEVLMSNQSAMSKTTFTVKLERPAGVGTWTYFTVPFNVAEKFGSKGQVKVSGTINGFPFRSSLFPRGNGKHYMVVNRAVREGANAKAGDTIRVALERDTAPRLVKVPRDLARALAAHPNAKARWDKLAYSHRKEYVEAIEEAKKPETRARRIAKAIEQLERAVISNQLSVARLSTSRKAVNPNLSTRDLLNARYAEALFDESCQQESQPVEGQPGSARPRAKVADS
jgi:predicted FMN-binding regulatory protein PaiB